MEDVKFNFDVDALIAKLEPAVQKVAEALGTGADNIWAIGTMGKFAEGVADLVVAAVAIVAVGLIVKGFRLFGGKDHDHSGYGDCGLCWCMGILATAGVVIVPVGVGFLYQGVMGVIAPEWMLLKEIIAQAKLMM